MASYTRHSGKAIQIHTVETSPEQKSRNIFSFSPSSNDKYATRCHGKWKQSNDFPWVCLVLWGVVGQEQIVFKVEKAWLGLTVINLGAPEIFPK